MEWYWMLPWMVAVLGLGLNGILMILVGVWMIIQKEKRMKYSSLDDFSKLIDSKVWTNENGPIKKGGVLAENSSMGVKVTYGAIFNPAGVPLWAQAVMEKGGGAVIVPQIVFRDNDSNVVKVLVGVLPNEDRPVAGGHFVEVPRGFSEVEGVNFEDPLKTAQRELAEFDEANVKMPLNRFTLLGGPFNMDTAIFRLPEGRGDVIYSCTVYPHEVDFNHNDGRITFKPGITADKKLSRCEFWDVRLVQTHCGISALALSLLRLKHGII